MKLLFEDFIMFGIDRSKVASMIYNIYKTMGKGLDFQKENLMKPILKHVVNVSRKD